ncbi:unnamed protein product [Rotaria socialis]
MDRIEVIVSDALNFSNEQGRPQALEVPGDETNNRPVEPQPALESQEQATNQMSGAISSPLLQNRQKWAATLTLHGIIVAVINTVDCPGSNNALDLEVAAAYRNNTAEFDRKALNMETDKPIQIAIEKKVRQGK